MKRPLSGGGPTNGLLRTEHFQVAYATNDIERARVIFMERFGIQNFRRLEGPLKEGGAIHIELAWVGSTMYELLTATGPGSSIYIDRLPTTEFAIGLHHLGFLICSDVEWQELFAKAARKGWSIPHESHTDGFMRSCFVDAPELGHYLEFLFPEPAGQGFLVDVPAN